MSSNLVLLNFYHPYGWMSFKSCDMPRLFIRQGIKKKVRNTCTETASSPATPSPAPLSGQCGGRWMVISNGEREEDEEEEEEDDERGRVYVFAESSRFFFSCCVSVVVVSVVAWGCDFCFCTAAVSCHQRGGRRKK